jgi:membrane associated rhomboid family serine protease
VIPIRDHNPTRSRPYVVYVIVVANVLVWLYEVSMLYGSSGGDVELGLFVQEWGVVPARLTYGPDLTAWLTPVSSMFMHGGWMHVIGNMWFLWVFGDNVEDELGKGRFVVFYLLCGLAAVTAQVMIDPSSQVPMVGASGAIAGVLAGYVMLHPKARITTLIPVIFIMFVEIPAYVFIFVWFGWQLILGAGSLGTLGDNTGGTAFFAHIGGFLAGLALVRVMGPRGGRRPPPRRVVTGVPGEWGHDRHRPLH